VRRIRLLGHPVHPFTVHLPLGLLMGVTGLDAAAWLGLAPWAADAAWWALAVGVAAAGAAATAGLVDYVAVPRAHPAGRMANVHLGLMSSALSAYVVSLAARGSGGVVGPLIALVGLALLLAGAWAGGEMVYGHAIGVRGAEERDPP